MAKDVKSFTGTGTPGALRALRPLAFEGIELTPSLEFLCNDDGSVPLHFRPGTTYEVTIQFRVLGETEPHFGLTRLAKVIDG